MEGSAVTFFVGLADVVELVDQVFAFLDGDFRGGGEGGAVDVCGVAEGEDVGVDCVSGVALEHAQVVVSENAFQAFFSFAGLEFVGQGDGFVAGCPG